MIEMIVEKMRGIIERMVEKTRGVIEG